MLTHFDHSIKANVDAKVLMLHNSIGDQRRGFENEISVVRDQIESAFTAHSALLATHRKLLDENKERSEAAKSTNAAAVAAVNNADDSSCQKIAMLQQQEQQAAALLRERDAQLALLQKKVAEMEQTHLAAL